MTLCHALLIGTIFERARPHIAEELLLNLCTRPMKIRFLNKIIDHQRFQYNAMHYDERKERLDRKKEEYKKAENGDMTDEDRRKFFRENIREGFSRAEYRQSQNKSYNIRVLILIAIIVGLGYFIFNGVDEVDIIVNKLWD